MEEAEQVRLARSGDREAFGRLVERYKGPVYRIVRGILGDAQESEDVAQEAFLKAYSNLGRFRGGSQFFTWLYRIAVNAALNAVRDRDPVAVLELREVEAPRPEPEEDRPSVVQLERMLKKLEEPFRTVMVLREIERLSYQEICRTLEIPLGTVESRLFRGRQELRALWRKLKEASNAM